MIGAGERRTCEGTASRAQLLRSSLEQFKQSIHSWSGFNHIRYHVRAGIRLGSRSRLFPRSRSKKEQMLLDFWGLINSDFIWRLVYSLDRGCKFWRTAQSPNTF